MAAPCTTVQHIALRDEQAPYRGKWLICSDADGHFHALRDTAADTGKRDVVEERNFGERQDAARFLRHLLLHGWSVYDVEHGASLMDQLW